MSGTGGTSYDPNPPRCPCERLTFRTVLNSPVPEVVDRLADAMIPGKTTLRISIEYRGALRMAAVMFDDERVGAITADALGRLLECIESGFVFVADVLSVTGARVEVQVRLG
jgi:hypothetical protein